MSFGLRIKETREAQKISQEKLATAINLKRTSIAQWESGATKELLADNLFKVAKALNVSAEWLLYGDANK